MRLLQTNIRTRALLSIFGKTETSLLPSEPVKRAVDYARSIDATWRFEAVSWFFDVGTAISYNMQCVNVKGPFGATLVISLLIKSTVWLPGAGGTAKHLLCTVNSWPT